MNKYQAGDLAFVPESLNSIWTGFGQVRRTISDNYTSLTMLSGKMKGKDGGFDTDKIQPAITSPVTRETLKTGDIVRLTRKAGNNENGWDNTWVEKMDKAVGEFTTVTDQYGKLNKNVALTFPSVGSSYGYPDFALVKVTTVEQTAQEQAPSAQALVVPANVSVVSLLKEARAIALQLATKNRLVNADQVQAVLTEKGLGRLGNAAGSLFAGKNWHNTGTSVQSTQTSARGRRIIVWEYTGELPDVPVEKIDVTTAVQVTPDNVKVGTRVALGPGYKVSTDQHSLGIPCVVVAVRPERAFPVEIQHVQGPKKGKTGICSYHELVLV